MRFLHLFLLLLFCLIFTLNAQENNTSSDDPLHSFSESLQDSQQSSSFQTDVLDSELNTIADWIPSDREVRQISLEECMEFSLRNNLQLKIASYAPKISETGILEARSVFDTVFFTGFDVNESTREAGSSLQGSENHNISAHAGLRKATTLGGTASLEMRTARQRTDNAFASLNPSWNTTFSLTLTQPLLKGLGWELNRIPLVTSQNNLKISHLSFEKVVIQTLKGVQQAYWDLVFSIADLKVKQTSLELANRLVAINNAKYEAGVIAKIEILQAETQVATRNEEVILAQTLIEDNEERLKKLIHPTDDVFLYRFALRPTNKPAFIKGTFSLENSLKRALAQRPELQQIQIELNNLRLQIKKTYNELLPTLNFTGSVGLSGLQGNFANSVDSSLSGDQYEWSTGFVFEVPLGNRGAKARYKSARLEERRKMEEYTSILTDIKFEISQILRNLKTLEARIEAAHESTKLAKEQLIAEEQRFNVGLSTNFDVSEVQEQYINALSRELKSIIDYKKALIDLEAAESSIIENYGLQFQR